MRTLIAAAGIGATMATLGCGSQPGAVQASQPDGARPQASLETSAGPVLVRCGPEQRALIRRVAHAGEVVAEVECVPDEATRMMAEPQPLLYVPEQPVRYAAATAPAPVARPAVQRAPTYRAAPARARKTRSGKDSALIIAGSTAAGAGVGAIIDGKKGALIGALIGGGAGTIYDRSTRHK
jgi:hypothetical protein